MIRQFALPNPGSSSRLPHIAAFVASLELALLLLEWLFHVVQAGKAAAFLKLWIGFLGLVLVVLLVLVSLRWFRRHVMWSVRNHLIVTYLFISGVPIFLLLAIGFISDNYLAKEFAAFLTISQIESKLEQLQSVNSFEANRREIHSPVSCSSKTPEPSNSTLQGLSIQVCPNPLRPMWLKDGFRGLVLDGKRIYLRTANIVDTGHEQLMVASSLPLDQELFSSIATGLGPVVLYLNGRRYFDISTESLPGPKGFWDKEFRYFSTIQVRDWDTGKAEAPDAFVLWGTTRISVLYSRLSNPAMGDFGRVVAILIASLIVLLCIFVAAAWLIGLRLTRTITSSVANLHQATECVNLGDFTHRIEIREQGQLASLQTAFNSMIESVQRLMAEQKEKERLQGELEIAYEVQTQLLPQGVLGTKTLELYGTCRPARVVSGDYYDFLTHTPGQVGIAIGDISGKGVSAALLMATVHSAIRAYEQEQLAAVGPLQVVPRGGAANVISRRSPARTLSLLNRHLYRSTQSAKYATLFLGFYDDTSCRLTYSNAGHLPPVILRKDGSTRRLDAGGTVVGLFEDREYKEEATLLDAGDLFIAFSDGLTEPENGGAEFGEQRLMGIIASCRDLSLKQISEYALTAVQKWIGPSEQPDDITLVLARRLI